MKETQEKKLAISYKRWSTDLQTGNSSNGRQDDLVTEVCKALNLTLIQEVCDDGVSARNGENLKANFSTLNNIMEADQYLIIEEWSRLSRGGFWMMSDALRPLIDKGVKIVIGKDDEGELVVLDKYTINKPSIINKVVNGASMAKRENDLRTDRFVAAILQKREKLKSGKYAPLNVCPCWLSQPHDSRGECIDDSNFVLDSEKAKYIQDIFDAYANKNKSITTIVGELNRNNIPTIFYDRRSTKDKEDNKRRVWSQATVSKLLHNRAVLGYYSFKRNKAVEFESKIFPPIISEELFYSTQRLLSSNLKYVYRGRPTKIQVNLFTSLLKCTCGGNLYQQFLTGGAGSRYAMLYCANIRNGTCVHAYHGLNAKRLEFAIKTILSMSDITSQLDKPVEIEASRLPTLELELETIRKGRKNLYNLAKQLNDPSELVEEIQGLFDKEKNLLLKIENENIRLHGSPEIKEAISNIKTFKEKWDMPEYRGTIRSILLSVLDHTEVNITEKTIKVWFKGIPDSIEIVLGDMECTINGLVFPYGKRVYNLKKLEK